MCRKVLITLGVLCFLSAAKAKADDFAYAYCPLGEGYVFLYDSPAGFQVQMNLKCGARLTVLDARDKDRLWVRTAEGKEGYVLKSSATAVTRGTPQQPAAPPKPVTQQPQPQAQPQPKPQPPAQAQVPSQPQMPAARQPELQTQAQPQVQSQPALQPEPPAQPQSELELQPPAPQPQAQPEPQAKPRQIEPEVQLQAEVEAPPAPKTQPRAEAQPVQSQPEPAATAFTPFSPLGYGQNIPRLEAFVGYSFLNAGTSGLATRQSVSGLEGSVAIHVNRWLAGEANIGAYYKTLQIINIGTFGYHDFLMVGGPRVNFHKMFVHALVGMDHLSGSTNFYAVNGTGIDNALAAAVGGGVQWSVTRQFAVRASGDYVMSRFEGVMQNNVRVTMGLVFQLGSVNSHGE